MKESRFFHSNWLWSFIGALLIILCVFIALWWFNRGQSTEDNFPRDYCIKEDNTGDNTKEEGNVEIKENNIVKEEQENVCYVPQAAHRSKGEAVCCQTMSNIFGKPFVTVRPDFLKNPITGRNLELDCYNDELKLAVEYNGKQHYVWPNYFIRTEEDFIKQVQRDKLKHELCERNGVFLITVPYTVQNEDIRAYLIEKLQPYFQYCAKG